jgi:hypothetical protein
MSLEVTIGVKDIEELSYWFDAMQERLTYATLDQQEKLKAKLSKVMSEDVTKRFASSPSTVRGGWVEGGQFWKPLSESYLANRPDRASGKIYIDSTQLMRSFEINSPNMVSRFPDSLTYEFGTTVPYAPKLNNMRQIIFFYDELLDKLATEFLEWALELPEDSKLENKGV